MFKDLSRIREKHPDMEVWSGTSDGAEQLAYEYALFFDIDYRGFASNWIENGMPDGHGRHQRILDLKPDLVVAFPGGKDTADCVERAKRAGIALWDRRTVDGHGK